MTASLPATMTAAWYERFGPAREVLAVGKVPVPALGHGDVLVRVHASGLNPHDVKKRSGWMGGPIPATRVIPHGDAAGTVAAVGDGLSHSAVGDRVWIYGAATDVRAAARRRSMSQYQPRTRWRFRPASRLPTGRASACRR